MPDRKAPASKIRLPKYRHYKPKNLAVVRLGGRDVYLGPYDSPESHEKYRRVVAEWLASNSGATPAGSPPGSPAAAQRAADGPTVVEIIDAFLGYAALYYRRADGTPTEELAAYKRTLKPLRLLYGGTPAKDFGPKKLKVLRQNLIDAGICRKTVNQRIGRIVHMFGWAVAEELIPSAVHHGLRAVKGLRKGRSKATEREPVKPVPDAHVEAVRPYVAPQVWAMIELQRVTAMRPGEVTIMRTGDIDRSGDVWEYTPAYHKTEHHDHARKIMIGPRGQEILGPWLRADPAAYLFSPSQARTERHEKMRSERKTQVQPSQACRKKQSAKRLPGERYSVRSYYRAIRNACDRVFPNPDLETVRANAKALPRDEGKGMLKAWMKEHRKELAAWREANGWWHPHQLRHTAATNLRREFNLDVARVILGHTSAAVTEIYAEVDREKAKAIMGQVG